MSHEAENLAHSVAKFPHQPARPVTSIFAWLRQLVGGWQRYDARAVA